MKRVGLTGMLLLLTVAGCLSTTSPKAAGENKSAAAAAKPVEKAAEKKQTLERADLYMIGSSCAACLMRIEGKLNKAPGVIRAAVSIYNPYPAIIIYDSSKTDLAKIKASIADEPAKFDRVTLRPIDTAPAVLLPPGGTLEGQPAH